MARDKYLDLDPSIWRCCAGSSVTIPTVNSRVYYFPQGHAEQASSPPDFARIASLKPFVLCRVVGVRFLANSDTDEVFTKVGLVPIEGGVDHFGGEIGQWGGDNNVVESRIVSFAKVLTPSDANNGGGFSVPRFCADSIFPGLDYLAVPPLQTIAVRDVHGVVWEFRHIYRGTPRRHLLTTGWSKFVNNKKLVAGDSVVFMRDNLTRELFVGVRRTGRLSVVSDCGQWNCLGEKVKLEEEFGRGEGFSRSCAGKVLPESVLKAVELAGAGKPFEIVCYPRAGSSDFLVRAEAVGESLNRYWSAGMRVKMAVETEDSARLTWFQGTITGAGVPDQGPWHCSPWRMLQVSWDEPEVLQNLTRVSPWQVETTPVTSPLHPPFPFSKKLRVSQNLELLTDGQGPMLPHMTGNLDSSLFNYKSFPVGIQGARHNPVSLPSLSNSVANSNKYMYFENHHGNNMAPKFSSVSTELHVGAVSTELNVGAVSTELNIGVVSTELNIGGTSQSDNSSPHSQGSVHFFGNSEIKTSSSSFQLFGKTIHTTQPVEAVEAGSQDGGSAEDDDGVGYKETGALMNLLEPSLSYPYSNLHNRLDIECQRVSAVEACPL
ncbi:hypothetical protein GIB67_017865 [Kingdonia uniflora]|uniref:Auxin response factor n=1 Tax=Kingdonia uniflora TaxID=39325 RepID=A0A7J7ML66_9MAGN|nr:hypothetical protein GIB67_017865 [Kingdonia uniflora]